MDKQAPIFFTIASDESELRGAKLLLESLRQFGGQLSHASFWVFTPPGFSSAIPEAWKNAQFHQIEEVPANPGYFFAAKACAWAQAENSAAKLTHSLIWIDPCCLILNEPQQLVLEGHLKAALRPVHIRNVGQPASQPLDGFWNAIYQQCGATPTTPIHSFVDEQAILPYFNSHCFCVEPQTGVLTRALRNLHALANDAGFMAEFCNDQLHRIFLFQCVLSATYLSLFSVNAIRLLPPGYGYPFHLQERIAPERQLRTLADIPVLVYEEEQNLPLVFERMQPTAAQQAWFASRN